jgi:hypothetical protein
MRIKITKATRDSSEREWIFTFEAHHENWDDNLTCIIRDQWLEGLKPEILPRDYVLKCIVTQAYSTYSNWKKRKDLHDSLESLAGFEVPEEYLLSAKLETKQ